MPVAFQIALPENLNRVVDADAQQHGISKRKLIAQILTKHYGLTVEVNPQEFAKEILAEKTPRKKKTA